MGCEETGCVVVWQMTINTLRRWRQKLEHDPDWFDRINMTGQRRLLDEEQEILMTGCVWHLNSIPPTNVVPIDYRWVQEEFEIEMTLPTVIACCDVNHLSRGIAKFRSASQVAASTEEQQRVALEFIGLLQDKGLYDVRQSVVCCMDITFAGHGKKVVHTVGPAGAYVTLFVFISHVVVFFILDGSWCAFSVPCSQKPQPLPSAISPWTDAIVACVWDDGRDRNPAMAFTFNPQMKKTHVADAAHQRKSEPEKARAATKEFADVCQDHQWCFRRHFMMDHS